MWRFEIGDFPNGIDAEEPEWILKAVEWCKSYLEFCCDPPLFGSYIDGIATEEETAQGSSISREVPWGIALFYEDGEEEEAEDYLEKCLVAYSRFCTAVDWVACHPTKLLSLFERFGYDSSVRCGDPVEHPEHPAPSALGSKALPDIDTAKKRNSWLRYVTKDVDINDATAMREAFQEAFRAIEAAKNDCCRLELVRLPPMLQECAPEWNYWVVKWIGAYIGYTCGAPPSGTDIKLNWNSSTRRRTTVGPLKVQCGWGLDWDGVEPPPQVRDFAERFRLAFYNLLIHVDWQQFDGPRLRSYFDDQGYKDYLDI